MNRIQDDTTNGTGMFSRVIYIVHHFINEKKRKEYYGFHNHNKNNSKLIDTNNEIKDKKNFINLQEKIYP